MTLAIDIIDGRGLSNEVHGELLPKKSNTVFTTHFTVKGIYLISCTLLTRQSASVLKVGMLCNLRSL